MDLNKEERTIGDSGLSIATHLTMENLLPIQRYDKEKPLANPINLNDYTYFLFNFYTLARNVYNSYASREKLDIIKNKQFYNVVEDEITILQTYFSNFNKTKFVIYKPNYDKVIKMFNQFKGDKNTVKYEDFVILDKYLTKFIEKGTSLHTVVDKTSYILPKMDGDVILMTHFPMDLLNKGRLHLIESHTGKLKSQKDFYTKFHTLGVRDLSNIPFCEDTYYIFGDTNFIKPLSVPIRRAVLAISMEKNWTYKTSKDLVKYHLNNDLETKPIYRQFKRIYP